MTFVSNDPSWWPAIDFARVFSYFAVASFTALVYDWALTLGEEVELVWRSHWSFMTVLYVIVRYVGILYSAMNMLRSLPEVSMTDAVRTIMTFARWSTTFVINILLGVIMIARLYAMYQRSRKVLIYLVMFLALPAISGMIGAIESRHMGGEELILSGTYQCLERGIIRFLPVIVALILDTVWEVIAMCFAVWNAVKYIFELQRPRTRWTIGAVLMQTHVFYFLSFAIVSCLNLGYLFPNFLESYSVGAQIYSGVGEIAAVVQMFVLGPRLILNVRGYHARSAYVCQL
ncbi:uncharacterized protein EDB91DRAFT_643945 [Suillus paluster]|uniref:uncharacterized protein n=1 Tax=Suillus paluster TaxID=48578 RepID=UPI001B85B55F|nr:uncharacterized protein EDB91DRAFT_643945 [Suillus paluster]KAG1733386.1 hypothetical protein EDB91DRAFT_643945 [Suillus paluster]